MTPRPTTLTTASHLANPPPNMFQVVGQVAYEFQVDPQWAFGRNRKPRQIIFRWACYRAVDILCDVNQTEMAKYFERDPSTICNALCRAGGLALPSSAHNYTSFDKRYHGITFRANLNAVLKHFNENQKC